MENNKSTKPDQKLKEKMKQAFDVYDEFYKDFALSKEHNKTFTQHMHQIMKERKVRDGDKEILINNKMTFNAITGLGLSTYERIKNEIPDYEPKLTTFMTLCMVYNLDITMASTLRHSFGRGFNHTNILHQAYCYLLVNCRGKSLSYCNKVLKELGINEKYFLGDKKIDEEEIISEIDGDI